MKNEKNILVSCIMPTANRQLFIPHSISYFLKQDYPFVELIIIDDGEAPIANLIPYHPDIRYFYNDILRSTGLKRNQACEAAKGDIIVHWDDDDWYAPDWVSRQVEALITSGADICGLNSLYFFSTAFKTMWNFTDEDKPAKWLYGATLAYWKSFWKSHPFKDMQSGEDNDFVWNSSGKISSHSYIDGYLGIVHADNTSMFPYENPKEKIQIIKWMKMIPEIKEQVQEHSQPLISISPLVSCIMPTANRQKFIPQAIKNFLKQDYSNAELVIVDDGKAPISHLIPPHPRIRYFYETTAIGTIGFKRNFACKIAFGEVILHWDDDDYYAPDWISKQVNALINSGADICGLDQIQFFSPLLNKYWMTKNFNSKKLWLSGATLVYWKSFWEKHPFKDLQIGEDDDFLRNTGATIFAHDYFEGFIAILHSKNTSIKFFETNKA